MGVDWGECPKCSEPLVERRNEHIGKDYLACSSHACDYSTDLPEWVRLRRLGPDVAPSLPGID